MMTSTKQWQAEGIPGCVEIHKAKMTGTRIGVYQAEQLGLRHGHTRWLAECEEHGEVKAAPSLVVARQRARRPTTWCDGCKRLVGGRRGEAD